MKIKVLERGSLDRPRGNFHYTPDAVFCYDPNCRDYDWLVVYDELPRAEEKLACDPAHTILATSEPVSIKTYSQAYVRQFAYLLTNRPAAAENHPGYRFGRGYYTWFVGRTYRECVALRLPPKSKEISAVCSSKQMKHTRHHERFELIRALAGAIPGFEWYGHGVKAFGAKFEVMDSFRYHVAVENHIADGHWSEKLADAFLCECLPFYAGAPDLAADFPAESFIPIPIDDPAAAVEIVRGAIAAGEYERRRDAVLEAKRRVLEKYNFWAQVLNVIASGPGAAPRLVTPGAIVERKALRWRSLSAALEDFKAHFKQYTGIN